MAMNERNLNESQWEDRKQWSLGVGQRKKKKFGPDIHTYIHTYILMTILKYSKLIPTFIDTNLCPPPS